MKLRSLVATATLTAILGGALAAQSSLGSLFDRYDVKLVVVACNTAAAAAALNENDIVAIEQVCDALVRRHRFTRTSPVSTITRSAGAQARTLSDTPAGSTALHRSPAPPPASATNRNRPHSSAPAAGSRRGEGSSRRPGRPFSFLPAACCIPPTASPRSRP